MAQNPVGWLRDLDVQDMERAKGFYASVLDARLERLNSPEIEMWAFPRALGSPGASAALVKVPGVPSGGNSTLVYFSCDDCATEAGRVVNAGGRVHKDKFSIGEYGFIALAFDTEGNLFGFIP